MLAALTIVNGFKSIPELYTLLIKIFRRINLFVDWDFKHFDEIEVENSCFSILEKLSPMPRKLLALCVSDC